MQKSKSELSVKLILKITNFHLPHPNPRIGLSVCVSFTKRPHLTHYPADSIHRLTHYPQALGATNEVKTLDKRPEGPPAGNWALEGPLDRGPLVYLL